MAHPPVPPIEGLGVEAVELPHPEGQVRPGGLDKEVVVVVHQAVGVAEPAIPGDDVREGADKYLTVLMVPKDPLPGIPPGGEMVDGTGIL
jgi:hypothetical protein